MQSEEIKFYHLQRHQPEKLQFEIYSLHDYLVEASVCALQPHIHSFYQIIWFTSGSGKHHVDFKEYEIAENTLFFLSKGQIHYFDENEYDGYIIHFNESFISSNENYTNIFLKHNMFNSFEREPFCVIKPQYAKALECMVARMQREMQQPNHFGHKECLQAWLNLFLIHIQRLDIYRHNNRLVYNHPAHILLVKFRQLVEMNFKHQHGVRYYADTLHISSKTLTNYTKEIVHQTPLQIINDRLMLEAKRLLSHSDKNINEIGFELGFDDASYFTKFFKRQEKLSPKEFRMLLKSS